MIHEIIYDGVLKKAATNPPNEFIGNVEMAAGIGIVLKEIGKEMNFDELKEPEDIKAAFLNLLEDVQSERLSDVANIIVERVKKYKVKKMVNETMEDLEILVKKKTS
ncbi:MAG: DUF3837 family protein [Lachnospiraceae bacterium]|nr:DUF3837 family protein [Lachnospiraceae bacterium]